jgi:hypothetical protein
MAARVPMEHDWMAGADGEWMDERLPVAGSTCLQERLSPGGWEGETSFALLVCM